MSEANKRARIEYLCSLVAARDAEIERLRAGLESIVNCRNPLTRAAVREACAEILAASTIPSQQGNTP